MFVNSSCVWYNKNMFNINNHMVEDMCILCSTTWYGVQNTGKRF